MEDERATASDASANPDRWESTEQVQCPTECDSDSNTYEDDQPMAKIKPEVELKEENDGFVYKTDMQGNLKLVCSSVNIPGPNSDICETSLTEIPSSHFADSSVELKHEYLPDKIMVTQNEHIKDHIDTDIPIDTTVDVVRYSDSFSSYSPHSIMNYPSEEEPFDVTSNVFPDLSQEWTQSKGFPESLNSLFRKQFDATKEEKSLKKRSDVSRPSLSSLVDNSSMICSKTEQTIILNGDIDDSVYKECAEEPCANLTSCSGKPASRKGTVRKRESISKTNDLTEAEKKRLYRQKIKDSNPELWHIIKQRDAAQKRQKRAHRQMITREMQVQLELESSHSENVQSLYLDALKERYPCLWEKLLHTVPEVRNRIDHKSRGAKCVTAYKDIIEAEKKRLYREKMKREKPEMWERQKARDAQRRSSQRLMKNSKRLYSARDIKTEKQDNEFNTSHEKLTYLQNLEVDQDQYASDQNSICSNLTSLEPISPTKTDYNNTHMDLCTPRNPIPKDCSEISAYGDGMYAKDSIKTEDNPSSTQSKMLWFWNDTPDLSRIGKLIPVSQGEVNEIPSKEIQQPSENMVKSKHIDKPYAKGSCNKISKIKREKD